ncbi:HECT domain protein [Aspergillus arachidicola]|uniref:HECT-type E3 ubiquitin transferase n=1 Tax=Aspergillus arachidicola TaxID=656916 RepID=A0A2G7GBU7_9EURO|nr:HECT domain protein [Aspergillus arachidicola]
MTRLRGASVSSYEVSHCGTDKPQFHRSKVPPNAPEVITQNTVDVSDPAQVLLWYRDERRRQFNLLVRRYKNQLLYGCQDPSCSIPTCASYRRRVTEEPFRRYTELSARTLACYLASVDNAESGLCRNTPRVPSDLSSQDHHRRSKRRSRASTNDSRKECSGSSVVGQGATDGYSVAQTSSDRQGDFWDNAGRTSSPGFALQAEAECIPANEDQSTQPLKDPKSFTQNLFDTLSLRMIEWLPLRRSPSTFSADSDHSYSRSSSRSPKPSTGHGKYHSRKEKHRQERECTSRQNTSTRGNPLMCSSRTIANTTAAVELKIPNQQIKRLSLADVDQRRQSPRSSIGEKVYPELKPARKLSINTHANADGLVNIPSPPALRHRPQKHRGRTGDGACLHEQPKKERRVSWDGAKLLNGVQVPDDQKPLSADDDQPASEPRSPSAPSLKHNDIHQCEDTPTIQSLTHLTSEIIDELGKLVALSDDEAERWKDELAYIESTGTFDDSEWRFATSRQREAFTFVSQSVFYALSSTRQILRSFRDNTAGPNDTEQSSSDLKLNLQQLQPSLRKLFTICPRELVFHSLWSAIESLFVPPKELSNPRQSRRSSYNSTTGAPVSAPIIIRRASDALGNEHVTDSCAADVATVALFALASSLPEIDATTWRGILQMRATGAVASGADMQKLPLRNTRAVVDVTDALEHDLALRLVDRLVRALTARMAFYEISKVRHPYSHASRNSKKSVLDFLINNLSDNHRLVTADVDDQNQARPPGAAAVIAEWLRTLLLKEWDGSPEMSKSSATGGAVQILSLMYKERNRLGLVPEDFHTPFLSERLEPLEMPVEWIGRSPNNKTLHLLSYPFLFPPSALVIYFRALNYAAMSRFYEAAMTTTRHVMQTAFGAIQIQDDVGMLARLKTSMTAYLVLVVRRDNLLPDALNQLWRRERRELMRPLKVQMGMDEGEEGLDHGGVQQEFFRVLMAEAWTSRMLLGLLMSLAVYNGLTLPINFPTAFYRKLLGLKVKHLDHIRDGWPELTKGLEQLLTWEDGDVEDVFMRTYEFSFEAFGTIETVDMQKVDKDAPWPLPSALARPGGGNRSLGSPPWSEVRRYTDCVNLSPPSSMGAEATESFADMAKSLDGSVVMQSPTPPAEEASFVTNRNRSQFVRDYIFWLTDKSIRPQFEAFAQGFYTCLDRSALSIFTPEALKTVVEGIQEIDMDELEHHARYEGGFGPSHRTIRDFWSIARQFSVEKKAQLLEFVTASDRVPVNGIASIMFVIQKNGVGDARLPTSLTCFGRLLLPEYSSRSVLEDKLNKALENARGFGAA